MSDAPSKSNPTTDSSRTLEIAHVLFTDIVGYSKLPMDEQELLLRQLQDAVRHTTEFTRVEASDELIRLPTGDGMALVFFGDAEAPVRCAVELGSSLRKQPGLQLRMGIHTGPVYRVADINANRNVAGGGINMAQRVMDCGDAGHILVSGAEAEVLGQLSTWSGFLHDLGEVEVKHGVRVHLYNLYTDEAGNPALPKKVAAPTPAAKSDLTHKSTRWMAATGATIVVVGLTVGGWLFHSRKAFALTDKDTIVLADFTNTTGDTVFDGTLRQGLSVQLEQSPFLRVISDQKIQQTLKMMGKKPDARLTPEITRELCQRVGSKAYLVGSIASLGSQYVLGLKAVDCLTGDTMAEEQERTTGKEQVLSAMDNAAPKLRAKLGESFNTVQKFDRHLEEATTGSLEALRAYSLGIKTRVEDTDRAAMPFFQNATELDPEFASAYALLGICYLETGDPALANENIRKAYELRDRVSERERFRISGFYFRTVTGELDKAVRTYELWAAAYPRDSDPHAELVVVYPSLGQYEKAVVEIHETLRIEPELTFFYPELVHYSALLNRLDDAEAMYMQAGALKFDGYWALHSYMYGVAFLREDAAEMQRQVGLAESRPEFEDRLLSYQSDTEAYHGHLVKARDFTRRAVESAGRYSDRETAATREMNGAIREAEFGNFERAREKTTSALSLASTIRIRTLAALAWARAGDSTQAQLSATELAEQNPLNTTVNGYWVPTIRGALDINHHDASGAIEVLQAASPYELVYPFPETELGGLLYPIFVRGQAYLLQRKGSEAAAEFHKFIEHRSIVMNGPLGALASLGLARAYTLQGDTGKAKAAYRDFLTLWKDADPDIPIFIAAKAEYAKLM
jgi:class 3 adenylate cyclase/tetratricopeptide (TPR) repeat protein